MLAAILRRIATAIITVVGSIEAYRLAGNSLAAVTKPALGLIIIAAAVLGFVVVGRPAFSQKSGSTGKFSLAHDLSVVGLAFYTAFIAAAAYFGHSGWIHLWSANGVLGGLIVTVLISAFAVSGYRQYRKTHSVTTAP